MCGHADVGMTKAIKGLNDARAAGAARPINQTISSLATSGNNAGSAVAAKLMAYQPKNQAAPQAAAQPPQDFASPAPSLGGLFASAKQQSSAGNERVVKS